VRTDLVIALVLVRLRMRHDASATGRNVWPGITVMRAAGSFARRAVAS
jgi:hypothetical protein